MLISTRMAIASNGGTHLSRVEIELAGNAVELLRGRVCLASADCRVSARGRCDLRIDYCVGLTLLDTSWVIANPLC